MNGMTAVQQRIADIEKRYAPKPHQAAGAGRQPDFAQLLGAAATAPDNSGREQVKKMVCAAAQKHQVPESLALAVAKAESGYDPGAVSTAGAVGVMQLMPDTASMLGVGDAFNAAENIDGGVRYLGMMLRQFGGDYRLAAAAYNAGPGAVEQHQGIPPYRETRAYVEGVMGTVKQGGGSE